MSEISLSAMTTWKKLKMTCDNYKGESGNVGGAEYFHNIYVTTTLIPVNWTTLKTVIIIATFFSFFRSRIPGILFIVFHFSSSTDFKIDLASLSTYSILLKLFKDVARS